MKPPDLLAWSPAESRHNSFVALFLSVFGICLETYRGRPLPSGEVKNIFKNVYKIYPFPIFCMLSSNIICNIIEHKKVLILTSHIKKY